MRRQRKQTGAKWRRHDLECSIDAGVEVRQPRWRICRCRDKFLAEVEKSKMRRWAGATLYIIAPTAPKPAPHCDASGLA